jgi:hypothetical protein
MYIGQWPKPTLARIIRSHKRLVLLHHMVIICSRLTIPYFFLRELSWRQYWGLNPCTILPGVAMLL